MKTIRIVPVVVLVAFAFLSGCASNGSGRTSPVYGVIQSIEMPYGDAAAGVAGGVTVGHDTERRNNAEQTLSIRVRLDSGDYATIFQKGSVAELHVGDHVRIENSQVFRN
jgi:outer membrane lipoprotein SlyB